MTESTERIVSLAMFVAANPVVTSRDIRDSVAGYSAEQGEDAFSRMFERDKEWLRENGFVIVTEPGADTYRLDRDATFAAEVELSPAEAAALRAVGLAMLDDPSFPFVSELRGALAKLATDVTPPAVFSAGRFADELPAEQGAAVALLRAAIGASKRVTFGYTNAHGESRPHEVEPLGLFAREGRWYLVARDTGIDEQRVYTVARMTELAPNSAKPKSPDFAAPDGFDVSAFIGMPFQYGAEEFSATLRFGADDSWRADALSGGHGGVEYADDDSATWTVTARDRSRLLRWVVDNGPGIEIVSPPELAAELRAGLEEVARAHG